VGRKGFGASAGVASVVVLQRFSRVVCVAGWRVLRMVACANVVVA